jgi:hypothetical protein
MSSLSADVPNHPMFKYLEENQSKIFANNKAWVASKLEADPSFFENLASGQHPDYLYVFIIRSRSQPHYFYARSDNNNLPLYCNFKKREHIVS